MKKIQFYSLELDSNLIYAELPREQEYDFFREDIYNLPLEYPYIAKMINGVFSDCTPQFGGGPIFSKKLRDIINQFVPQDGIEWIHLKVENKDGSPHDGYVPRLVPRPDMWEFLHESSIITEHGDIMVPRLSTEKLQNIHYVQFVESTNRFYISEELKQAIQEAKCTGIGFEKIKMYP